MIDLSSGDGERTTNPAIIGSAKAMVFHTPEALSDNVPSPTGISGFCPSVVVRRLAAGINHSVDGACAPQRLSTRPNGRCAVDGAFRFCLEAPSIAGIIGKECKAFRHGNQRVAIFTARFDEKHTVLAAFRQPVCKNTTCRARAHYDVIEDFPSGHAVPGPIDEAVCHERSSRPTRVLCPGQRLPPFRGGSPRPIKVRNMSIVYWKLL